MVRHWITPLVLALALAGCNTGTRDPAPGSTAPGSTAPGSTAQPALGATPGPAPAATARFGPDPAPALTFALAAGSADADVTQIVVDNAGSADESTLGGAELYDDANGNGAVDAGEAVLATSPAPAADDAPYTFQPSAPIRIAAGQSRAFVVAVDLGGAAGALQATGKTLELSLQSAASVTAQDPSGASVAPTGTFPMNGSVTLAFGDHVLISEVCTGPGTGTSTAEFVELFNPTAQAVDLSNHYLTDFTNDPTRGEFYWKLPTGQDFGPAGGAFSYDFLVRFPLGTQIQPGQVLTVAVDGGGFQTAHGISADFAMRNAAGGAQQMLTWDGVAPGVAFGPTGIHASAGLTGPAGGNFGNGEMVALFRWDGTSDLVVDVDILNYGNASATNTAVNKSAGQGIPDVKVDSAFDNDSTESTFQDDADDLFQLDHRAPLAASIQRVDFTEGAEVKSGGNGEGGHNETSEDFGDGMGGSGTFAPGAAPTPGQL
jgi:hypothetical protein